MTRRRPAVAGQFYPGSAKEIGKMLAELVDDVPDKEKVIGVMAPHAGWIYSGRSAGMLYGRIVIPETVLIMCPNHRGVGEQVAIMAEGTWELPGGDVELEPALAGKIMGQCEFVKEDSKAHSMEHSLEVHLPLIRRLKPDFKLVPISLGRVSYKECEELGRAIASAVADFGREVLVVASSDMTHFESAKQAREKDMMALDCMLDLDPEDLFDTVGKNRISMCGVVPATVMLVYALKMGAKKAELVDYRNSGDVTGDNSEVVAYASVTIK